MIKNNLLQYNLGWKFRQVPLTYGPRLEQAHGNPDLLVQIYKLAPATHDSVAFLYIKIFEYLSQTIFNSSGI